MNPYIKQLNKYLTEHSLDCSHSETDSILELLYGFYTECNHVDHAVIKQHFNKLGWIFEELTLEKSDLLFGTICDLYAECERLAFIAGTKIGARLENELDRS